MYRAWRQEHGNRKPNRVTVRMHWEDDPEVSLVDTVAIEPQDSWIDHDDELILWYSSSVDGIYELTRPGNGSDFVVDEVLGFYRKDEVL